MYSNKTENSRSRIVIISVLILGVIVAIGLLILFWGDADNDGSNSDSFFGILFNDKDSSRDSDPLRGGVIIGETDGEEGEEMTLYLISQDPVIGAALSADEKHLRYFKRAGGNLFENEFTGANETRVSNITIPAILDVQWTPSKAYAIISFYADGNKKRISSHYTGTSTVSSSFLPSNIEEITASLVDDMIAYTVLTEGETVLFTARPDNTNIRKILTLPAPDFELSWPVANTVAIKQKSSAYAPSILYTLNPSSKLLTRVLDEKMGLDTLWSSSAGSEFLYMETEREGTRAVLHVTSLKENTATDLPVITLPEKCAWAPASKNTLFCAVPESLPKGANLPDEWWQGVISFNDGLWQINTATGERQQILPTRQLDAINLFLSKDESFLFFTNKKDGSLWSLRLNHET